MITFHVKDLDGAVQLVEVPDGISLSLMEVLKASDYPIPATCGGMALCATCHVEVTKGWERLEEAKDMELDMIDTLPSSTDRSRLACQIRVSDAIEGAEFQVQV
ncbi:MAG: 2Fe-2S iron-sulfur cluster-binding protein [Chryseolinea sp.]